MDEDCSTDCGLEQQQTLAYLWLGVVLEILPPARKNKISAASGVSSSGAMHANSARQIQYKLL
jgi:hypothetical protein